ncbi:MAG: hypothetical protein Q9166_004765 [cf. Caloplaca sp. 2 TL-2023]
MADILKGGTLKSVKLHPPPNASTQISKADDWKLDLQELEDTITSRTRILVLNTPHNPLGKVFSIEELTSIGNICVKYGIIILSDEVYERLHYTDNFPRLATLDARFARQTVTIGSVGKSFNATGWRVGYAIGDKDLIKHVHATHVILAFTTAGPAQLAAAFGLEHAEQNLFWQTHRTEMKRKIDSLCEVFRELGLPYVEPSGAHYVLLNAGRIRYPEDYPFPSIISGKTRDWKLCWFLLQEFGIATIPMTTYLNILVAASTVLGFWFAYPIVSRYFGHRQAARNHGCRSPPSIVKRDFMSALSLRMGLQTLWFPDQNQRNTSIVQLFAEYGHTMQSRGWGSRAIYTIEPKNLQALFSTDFASWGVEPMRLFAFEPFVGKGIMCTDGKLWEHSRALIKPTFTRTQIADLHLSAYASHVRKFLDLIPRNESTVDLQPLFSRLALDSSTQFLFGESVGSLAPDQVSKEANAFLEAYTYGQYVVGKRLHLPKWNFLTWDKRFWESCEIAQNFVDRHIARAQRIIKDNNGAKKTPERYILAHELVKQTADMNNIRNQLLNVFLPAHEAAAVALTNVFFNLARNPHVYRKLREEILRVAEDQEGEWTFERLKSLRYLHHVINETFRLNPAIGTNSRIALQDTILPTGGGPIGFSDSPIFVKKNDTVTVSFYALHRRDVVFGEDMHTFRPERWEGLRPPPWSYLTFGGGPRVCPGQNLALTEVAYTIVKILQTFKSIENRDPVIGFVEVYKITTSSRNGAKVSLSPA